MEQDVFYDAIIIDKGEKMRSLLYAIPLLVLFLNGCATPPPQTPAYNFVPPIKQLDYLADVEPVLVKRCVVCHSCTILPASLNSVPGTGWREVQVRK